MIECPVCKRKNIEGNTCPQCDTDLTPLIRLMQLPGKHHEEGVYLLEAGRTNEAIEELVTALSLNPQDAGIYLSLGKAYSGKGMHEEAIEILERALKIDPDNPDIKNTIPEIKVRRDDQKRAAQKSKRRRAIFKGAAIGVPILTFLLGLVIIPLIKDLSPEPPPDIPALSRNIDDAISRFPELKDLQVRLSQTGQKILVSGEVPSELHKDFIAYLAGNTASTELVDTSGLVIRVPEKPSEATWTLRYTVRSGDTLSLIALSLYGDTNRWNDLYQINQDIVPEPGVLMPGQILKIPLRREKEQPPDLSRRVSPEVSHRTGSDGGGQG